MRTVAVGALRGNGERHRDAVVAVAVDRAAAQRAALRCSGAVGRFLDVDAERAQAGRHRRDAVGFLDPQLRRAAHHGRARCAQAAATNSAGNSSIMSGTSAVGTSMPCSGACAHAQIGDRLAALLALRMRLDDVRAHRAQRVQQAGAARIDADRLA